MEGSTQHAAEAVFPCHALAYRRATVSHGMQRPLMTPLLCLGSPLVSGAETVGYLQLMATSACCPATLGCAAG